MAPRFFAGGLLDRSRIGTTIALPDEVVHHALRVLRLPDATSITLFDGSGGEYRATLVHVGRRDANARLEGFDPVERDSPLRVTLVQSILATDAMDFTIRKAVELGAAALVPVFAARSQRVRSGERSDKRLAHWRAIAVAACEQCGRNRIPAVTAPEPLDDWLRAEPRLTSVLAGPHSGESLVAHALRKPPEAVVIGPEGGFTAAELALAGQCGVVAVHLGPRVLRAETAAMAALATLAAIAGDAR
jgi:16S rRNA (uracil1498-N3)-methyltransferase